MGSLWPCHHVREWSARSAATRGSSNEASEEPRRIPVPAATPIKAAPPISTAAAVHIPLRDIETPRLYVRRHYSGKKKRAGPFGPARVISGSARLAPAAETEAEER